VDKKGNTSHFEGDMHAPPKKDPKSWPFIDGHNMKAVNAIIFGVISLLREDPLSPGILDMFFLKISNHSSLCKTEFIYSKFHQIINSTTHQILSVGSSSSP
jgi:hypothetical protein